MYDKRRKEIMTHCFEPSKSSSIKSDDAESSIKSPPSLKRELAYDNCQSKHKKSDMKGEKRFGQDVLAESSKSPFDKSGNKSSTKSQSSPHRKNTSDNHQIEHKKNVIKGEKKLAHDVLAESSKSPFAKSDTKSSTSSQSSPQRESTSDNHESEPKKNDVEQKDEKLLIVGDWVVQKSSAGKKYYYNNASDISQWEKPKEILEFEQQQNLKILTRKIHGKKSNNETSNKDTKMSSTAALYNQLKQLEVVLEDVMKSKDYKDYKYKE